MVDLAPVFALTDRLGPSSIRSLSWRSRRGQTGPETIAGRVHRVLQDRTHQARAGKTSRGSMGRGVVIEGFRDSHGEELDCEIAAVAVAGRDQPYLVGLLEP